MATKSFLKSVALRDRGQCKAFIRALERSEEALNSGNEKPSVTIRAHELTKEQILKLFGGENGKADRPLGE